MTQRGEDASQTRRDGDDAGDVRAAGGGAGGATERPGDPGYRSASGGTLDRALDLVRFLRANCSWDAEQTPRSLVPHLLEEAHETADAALSGDADELEGELGDLLLNLAFQVVLLEEDGAADAESVTRRLEAKMRRRHPHLYGLGEREDWETLKARERGAGGGVLDGLSETLDPLTRAHRIQERVATVGFDWADFRGAFEKVEEELAEVREALERAEGVEAAGPGPDPLEEELGDLLFAAVNLVRLAGHHPTPALDRANRKFRRRFEALERLAAERDVRLGEADLATLDGLWDELKAREREGPAPAADREAQ